MEEAEDGTDEEGDAIDQEDDVVIIDEESMRRRSEFSSFICRDGT